MPDRVEDNLCFIVKDNDEVLSFVRNDANSAHDIMAMWTNSGSMIYTVTLLFNYIWSSSKSV